MENNVSPIPTLKSWFEEAKSKLPYEYAISAALATATKNGVPDVRMVLVKSWDDSGFYFYTNYRSSKSQQIDENPVGALCFFWYELGKQIRIRGPIAKTDEKVSDDYFKTRDRLSQIGAWASKQSQILPNRFILQKRIAYYIGKFGLFEVPRPNFWGGFKLIPLEIEFWLRKPYRLHERIIFKREELTSNSWDRQFLFP
ncbi:MAG: pyridoxamine 5'-phosphate oxidase [Candidatus Hydrogenedentes bacterium]|nr:pyridoxamine 5'-phosphate oxidase [Candidatus Hydrogenedentota bacterium]